VGRRRAETVVAIVSLGSPRRFLLRPKGGGPSRRLAPAPGDLLVLGGTCQRTWEHSVPKCASAGPRISIMFRESY
jgi:alkylated DNA repair dioxygenase AlkB